MLLSDQLQQGLILTQKIMLRDMDEQWHEVTLHTK